MNGYTLITFLAVITLGIITSQVNGQFPESCYPPCQGNQVCWDLSCFRPCRLTGGNGVNNGNGGAGGNGCNSNEHCLQITEVDWICFPNGGSLGGGNSKQSGKSGRR